MVEDRRPSRDYLAGRTSRTDPRARACRPGPPHRIPQGCLGGETARWGEPPDAPGPDHPVDEEASTECMRESPTARARCPTLPGAREGVKAAVLTGSAPRPRPSVRRHHDASARHPSGRPGLRARAASPREPPSRPTSPAASEHRRRPTLGGTADWARSRRDGPTRATTTAADVTGSPATAPASGPGTAAHPRNAEGAHRTVSPSGRTSISGSRRSRCPRAGSPRRSRGPGRGSRSRRSRRSGTARPWPPRWARPRCCRSGADPFRPG